jgi:ribonuclease HII
MGRAAQKASRFKAEPVLIDGPFPIPAFKGRQIPIVKGDQKSLAVACASIIAKVYRDRWMEVLDRRFPGYGFSQHKGYGTKSHLKALLSLGASPAHRKTYGPVAKRLNA